MGNDVMRLVGGLCLLSVLASSAVAQINPTDSGRRKVVVPYIRALTDCIAQTASNDSDAVTAHAGGTLAVYLRQQIQHCPNEITALLNEYDQVYGEGEGATFVRGAYSADLERAVLSRIRGTLDKKVADARQQRESEERQAVVERARQEQQAQAEAAERDRQQAQAHAEQEARLAEARQNAEAQKAAAIQAEADARAAVAKAEAEKQTRLDNQRRAMSLLRDKFDACALHQLRDLVKSGEAAGVLASAVLTICSTEVGIMDDSATTQWSIEQGHKPGETEIDAINTSVQNALRERTTAFAVQAKAGAGPFSASTPDPASKGLF